jgi:membrane-associated phospholipid phosphatase
MENLSKQTAVAAAVFGIMYITLFLFFDRAIDLWVHNNCSGTWVHQYGTYISYLAKGDFFALGIALGFILLLCSGPCHPRQWTRYLLFICLSLAIAIIIGEGLKYLLGRYRPVMLFKDNLYGLHFLSGKWELNSTPSGHSLRAFALMTALSLLYRRFTVVFISVAVLIALSRVAVTDHYPSDVLFGAFIGIFTALWTYKCFLLKNNALEKRNVKLDVSGAGRS